MRAGKPIKNQMNRGNSERARASYRNEREFGLIVGFILVLLGGWWIYKGNWQGNWRMAPFGFLALGSLLVVPGLLFPRALVYPNRAWMALARSLSLITTPIILAIVYFAVFMPIGAIKRLFGWDPLRRRAVAAASYWGPYNPRQRDSRHFEKMF